MLDGEFYFFAQPRAEEICRYAGRAAGRESIPCPNVQPRVFRHGSEGGDKNVTEIDDQYEQQTDL